MKPRQEVPLVLLALLALPGAPAAQAATWTRIVYAATSGGGVLRLEQEEK
jgi:hypothetical protein